MEKRENKIINDDVIKRAHIFGNKRLTLRSVLRAGTVLLCHISLINSGMILFNNILRCSFLKLPEYYRKNRDALLVRQPPSSNRSEINSVTHELHVRQIVRGMFV